MTGVDLVHVPYRGAALVLNDLLAGQVQVTFSPIASSLGYIRADRLRALAVTGAARSPALPDVPTVSEFLPGYEASAVDGIGAPGNTPAESSTSSTPRSMPRSPTRRSKRGLPTSAAFRYRCRRRNIGLHRGRNREMGEGDQIRRHQGGLKRGKHMERREVLQLAAGAAALTLVPRRASALDYPTRPVPSSSVIRRVVARHHRAPGRAIGVGAARAAIHRRQSAGRRQQYRHRSCRPRHARRLHATLDRLGQCHQRHALSASEFRFRARPHAGRLHRPHAVRHRGQSAIAGEIGARADRLRQGQSRQDQYARPASAPGRMSPASCSR